MRGDIYGSLGRVTKGDPGLSAYEIAVKNGFVGTEQEWLDSLKAEAAPAEASAVRAESAAVRAETAETSAKSYADDAKRSMRSASDSEDAAYASKTAAANSAREATMSASSAAENAAYIAGRVNAAMTSADQAAVSESHAEASAGRAWQSEANAKQSELMAAEYYTRVRDASGEAAASASAAAGSATQAANSALQASTLISQFNANVELSQRYASIAGGYANSSQTYAVAAADAANRAEIALGNALAPLVDYYNKEQVDSIVAGEASIRGAEVLALQTAVADRYTKQEVDTIVLSATSTKLKREIVAAVTAVDSPDPSTIYMVNDSSVPGNIYTEYMYMGSQWEIIGTSETELSQYEKKEDIAPYKEKLDSIEAGAQVNTVTGVKGVDEIDFQTGDVVITPSGLGLGDVDNTHDSIKAVAYASVAGAANSLDTIDLTGSYVYGDVVFSKDESPSTCYVCVVGGVGPDCVGGGA